MTFNLVIADIGKIGAHGEDDVLKQIIDYEGKSDFEQHEEFNDIDWVLSDNVLEDEVNITENSLTTS